jgi:hypothetical protein
MLSLVGVSPGGVALSTEHPGGNNRTNGPTKIMPVSALAACCLSLCLSHNLLWKFDRFRCRHACASSPAGIAAGITLISVDDAAAPIAAARDDLIILDAWTPEEFNEGQIDSAVTIDFCRDNFANQLAELGPGVLYVHYCCLGSLSGQTPQSRKSSASSRRKMSTVAALHGRLPASRSLRSE